MKIEAMREESKGRKWGTTPLIFFSASREKMIGSTLYLCGKENETGKYVSKSEPCSMCKRMIINAGISTVIVRDDKENYRVIEVENWINNDDSLNGEDSY